VGKQSGGFFGEPVLRKGGVTRGGLGREGWLRGDSAPAGDGLAGRFRGRCGEQRDQPCVEGWHLWRRGCLSMHGGAGEQNRDEEQRRPHIDRGYHHRGWLLRVRPRFLQDVKKPQGGTGDWARLALC
jgi:hypothetical protein